MDVQQVIENKQAYLGDVMKTVAAKSAVIILLACLASPVALAQDQNTTEQTQTDISDAEVTSEANEEVDAETSSEQTEENQPNTIKRSAPNTQNMQIQLLKAQYPERDIINLNGETGEFTALWKKDQSGAAYGAVLLVPSNGQTANWPNTIDVLRNELPKNGWSTLSIDIAHSTSKDDTGATQQQNIARLRAAIAFLNEQGQYNIVLAGYGLSCSLIVEYATHGDALGMKRSVSSSQTTKLKRPVRALILISPLSQEGERLSEKISEFPFKDMPMLDIVFGSHYLDTFDSKERVGSARSANIEHYLQTKSVEPSSSARVFGNDNRLSRRVRGFLDTHAKGVEIERR